MHVNTPGGARHWKQTVLRFADGLQVLEDVWAGQGLQRALRPAGDGRASCSRGDVVGQRILKRLQRDVWCALLLMDTHLPSMRSSSVELSSTHPSCRIQFHSPEQLAGRHPSRQPQSSTNPTSRFYRLFFDDAPSYLRCGIFVTCRQKHGVSGDTPCTTHRAFHGVFQVPRCNTRCALVLLCLTGAPW